MPDLITHTIIARMITSFKWRRFAWWFVLGTVLPDLLTRAPMFFLKGCYNCSWFFAPFHTPLILVLVSLLISAFFRNKEQLFNKVIFWSLLFGSVLHMLLDFFQIHIKPGYYYLFPFSFESFEIGLFWPEASLKILPITIIVFLIFLVIEKKWLAGQGVKKEN